MARVVKAPIVRRAELLDSAQELFFTLGYEATTVNDIIARAGVSKGGFYHHFDSKEALFEAFLERIIDRVLQETNEIMAAAKGDALAQLNTFFARARHWKIDAAPHLRPAFDAVLKPNNEAIFQRILATLNRVMAPVLTELIENGVRAGVFDTPDPALAAETLLQVAASRRDIVQQTVRDLDAGKLDDAVERIDRRIAAEEAIFDRVLGLPAGSVRLGEAGFARAVLERMMLKAEVPHAELG